MSRTRFCPLPLRLIFVIVHEKSTRSFNAEFDASALIACTHMHGVSERELWREKKMWRVGGESRTFLSLARRRKSRDWVAIAAGVGIHSAAASDAKRCCGRALFGYQTSTVHDMRASLSLPFSAPTLIESRAEQPCPFAYELRGRRDVIVHVDDFPSIHGQFAARICSFLRCSFCNKEYVPFARTDIER